MCFVSLTVAIYCTSESEFVTIMLFLVATITGFINYDFMVVYHFIGDDSSFDNYIVCALNYQYTYTLDLSAVNVMS